jgi:hypothetical protein
MIDISITLEHIGSLLLEPRPLVCTRDAQVGEHDSALFREQLGLGIKLFNSSSLFGEINEGGACGLFLGAPYPPS